MSKEATINTLKTAKVGDKVTMLTFTGMNLGQFEITKSGKTKIALMKKDGTQAEFSRETGEQLNAANPKFANRVVDPMPVPEKKAPVKKAAKPEEKAEEATPEAKPEPKATKPAAPAKKVEKVEIEDDADDFDDEADFDDDFEEFDEE